MQVSLQGLKAFAADRSSIPKKYQPYDNYAERALMIGTQVNNSQEKWWTDFISGNKSIDTNWSIYINELKEKGVDDLNTIYYGS